MILSGHTFNIYRGSSCRIERFAEVQEPDHVRNNVFFTLCLSSDGSRANLPPYPYAA